MMLEHGVFPQALKVTKIIPLYKKGEISHPSSYQPISLVHILSKVFESCVKDQLGLVFYKNGLLCKELGFLSNLTQPKP